MKYPWRVYKKARRHCSLFRLYKSKLQHGKHLSASFDTMVNIFIDADELMNFAATWGFQNWPAVRFRLFQPRNPQYGDQFVTEQLNDILHNLPSIDQQNEIDACEQPLLIDDEIEESTHLCLEDPGWDPFNIQSGQI